MTDTKTSADLTPSQKPKRARTGVIAAMDRSAQMMSIAAAHAGELTGKSGLATFTSYSPEQEASISSAVAATINNEAGKDIREIFLKTIHPNPFQPREVYTPEAIRERADSLKVNGQLALIHVIPHPDIPGEFMIGDGWTRVSGCIEHNVCKTLFAEVHHDLSPEDAAWLGYRSNEEREQFCDLDKSSFFAKLYDAGVSQREVSRKTGISQAKLSFLASFKKLPTEVLDVIRLNPKVFTAFAIPNLVKVADRISIDKATTLALAFSTGELTTRQFVNQCAAVLDKKPTTGTNKKSSKVVRYSNGTLRQKGGRFDLTVEVPETEREQFNLELEELLKRYTTDPIESQLTK